MREYWVEELSRPIRLLYPAWALLRRPALPASLGAKGLLHSPVPAAVPPAVTAVTQAPGLPHPLSFIIPDVA